MKNKRQQIEKIQHKFVKNIPINLDEGCIYISIPYSTATHLCFCGCGQEITTPIKPSDWTLIFDGETISLYPSIGLGKLKCKSHYYIIKNEVLWLPSEVEQIHKKRLLHYEHTYMTQFLSKNFPQKKRGLGDYLNSIRFKKP